MSNVPPQLEAMEKFPDLLVEIRFEIWRWTFELRRVVLKRHSYRLQLDPHSHVALLLVNKEARRIFLEHHKLILHQHGQRGIYFYFKTDNFGLMDGGLRPLLKLMEQYLKKMEKVQYK
ncbi:hypothetical protein N431DRAFT_443772 [Stipitochalara longipes BDJ]|nr:hypothetical protein N431DRAFT_443772 [Stipitochalara longipes BDJ]